MKIFKLLFCFLFLSILCYAQKSSFTTSISSGYGESKVLKGFNTDVSLGYFIQNKVHLDLGFIYGTEFRNNPSDKYLLGTSFLVGRDFNFGLERLDIKGYLGVSYFYLTRKFESDLDAVLWTLTTYIGYRLSDTVTVGFKCAAFLGGNSDLDFGQLNAFFAFRF